MRSMSGNKRCGSKIDPNLTGKKKHNMKQVIVKKEFNYLLLSCVKSVERNCNWNLLFCAVLQMASNAIIIEKSVLDVT